MQADTFVIIGTGRIAQQLIKAFDNHHTSLCYIFGRSKQKLNQLISEFPFLKQVSINEIQDNATCLLAVNDSAISEVAQSIENKNTTLIHFSGAVALDLISHSNPNSGVFWPIKSFASDDVTSWSNIPVAAEPNNDKARNALNYLNSILKTEMFFINAEKRAKLHLAAVTVNNFSNHLFHLAFKWCKKNNLPFESLVPIIQQTALRIKDFDPAVFQTGPAIRGDEKSIQKHLDLLKNDHQFLEIYKLLSRSIQES